MNSERVALAEHSAQRGLRDLMSLLTLPALWLGRDAEIVLSLTTSAVERILRLDLTYFDVQISPDSPVIKGLRVSGHDATSKDWLAWAEVLGDLSRIPISAAAVAIANTPIGPLRVVRVSMGYSAIGGSIWFAATDLAFPTTVQSAALRAASTLAATGLQGARMEEERARASRAKDEFLAMLGHELRNPLAPIFTSLDLIRMRSGTPLTGAHAVIERQAIHLSRLVDDLLDVSRITRGKLELNKAFVAIDQILSSAIEAVQPLIQQRRHELTMSGSLTGARVYGDQTRLIQVFSNLLTNAAKYTGDLGSVHVLCLVTSSEVSVAIQDNGAGIDPALMPRLFKIFEQGDTTIDRSRGGLGIGLALVQSFVSLHGGTVTAVSGGTGQGSTFTVTLPLVFAATDSGQDVVALEATGNSKSSRTHRILLVDDNIDALESTAEILRLNGMEVAVAADPYKALALLPTFMPDTAVLDIGLPGMSGYQLAEEMKRLCPTALRLIALSGYGQVNDLERSKAAGFDRHLTKPVAFDVLVQVITRIEVE